MLLRSDSPEEGTQGPHDMVAELHLQQGNILHFQGQDIFTGLNERLSGICAHFDGHCNLVVKPLHAFGVCLKHLHTRLRIAC
jgi:hypothetical protein